MWMKSAELRGHGEEIEMTKEQMDEYVRCSKDIFHFSKYFYILTDDGDTPPISIQHGIFLNIVL